VRIFWLAVIPACVASVDALYIAGDDVDDEDTTQHAASTGPVTFDNSHGDYVDWHNDQGTYRIYKRCLGPKPGADYIGYKGTVGPGYIATVWNRNRQIVLDDSKVPLELGPNSGAVGLGMFGLHLLRVPSGVHVSTTRELDPATGKAKQGGWDYTHQLAGRWCNDNRMDDDYGGYRGWGVHSASVLEQPKVAGNVGELVIDVVLGDASSDLVDVKYTYRIGSDYVKQWVRVTNLCNGGTCNGASTAYVKEPKVIAGVNPADPDAVGLQQMNTFNNTGHTGSGDKVNHWNTPGCSADPAGTKLCEWGGKDPRAEDGGGTGQCSDPERRRVRFWNPQIACAADPSCLVVAARGADTELGPSYPWEGPHGLDLWAQNNVSQGRAQFASQDSLADGFLSGHNCWNTSASEHNRRWEMAGIGKTAAPACNYTTALAAFHAWEGGTGTYDCEPLYYTFGPAQESYVVAMSYGFGAAPLP
jgi:hypothetical protein